MMGRGLSIFLVLLAIFFDAEAKAPKNKSCSKSKNCKKCLNDPKCAWQVDPDFTGCIDISECDSDEEEEGKCLVGKTDSQDYNEYACGKTCSTQPDATCEDCLDLDIFGSDKKKSDCAWFVKPGTEPKCIYQKECEDKGSEGGKCIRGKKKKSKNSEKCDYKAPIDKCEKNDDCKKCLKKDCAWFTNGKDSKCIAEKRCDDRGFEMGECYKGSEIFDYKDTCKNINKPSKPNLDDEVGFEKCSDFSGMCTDCLISGCFWSNASKECYDSCDEAPLDVGCSGTTPPVSINNRAFTKFDSEASEMCYKFKLEDKNDKLCGKVKPGDCTKCVETTLYTPPDEFNAIQPTCQYSPDSGDCFRECPPLLGGCQSICPIPEPPVYELPPVGKEFPDLLGEDVKVATKFLEETYGPDLDIQKVVKGKDVVTEEIQFNRIRLWVDKKTEKTIVEVPRVG
jgi:hypothetical protein